MNYSHKVFLLAFLPVVITMMLTIVLVNKETKRLSYKQSEILNRSLLELRQKELINYTDLAIASIDHIYEDTEIPQSYAKERASEILTDLSYSQDGYFYAYTVDGTNVVHPKQPYRIGNNYWKLKDLNGNYVIQDLIFKAKTGGGFTNYSWDKPSINKTTQKIGYSRLLENWGWMIGTGVYTDDIESQVVELQTEMGKHVKSTSLKILGMALIAGAFIFLSGMALQVNERKLADDKLQELTKRIINAQDEERRRVSRELHDGISQSLAGVKYYLEEAGSLFEKKSSRHAELVDKSNQQLQLTMQEVRRISRDLHPSVLDDFGLMTAVEALVTELKERSDIKITLNKVKVRNLLPQDVKTALYRVTQEAITNIERHSSATEVLIDFSVTPRWFKVIIADNGKGFNPDDQALSKSPISGIGLRNMVERLSYFKGKLEIKSNSSGTRLYAFIPKNLVGIQETDVSS